MKLNLGCSSRTKEGWVNVVCRELPNVDLVVDLNVYPWPFEDESIDEVFAAHVLEHLYDPYAAIKEIKRILKKGGKVKVIVPNGAGFMAHAVGHHSLLSRQWFRDIDGNPDHQNNCVKLFSKTEIKFGIFHYCTVWNLPLRIFTKIVETVGNSCWPLQFGWEVSGICVPGEIRWTAIK